MITILQCSCTRHRKPFRAVFEGRQYKKNELLEPPPPTLLDRLRAVANDNKPEVQVKMGELDVRDIRCAWCEERMYYCHCGIMACKAARKGDLYTCVCGSSAELVQSTGEEKMNAGRSNETKLLPGVKRLLLTEEKRRRLK